MIRTAARMRVCGFAFLALASAGASGCVGPRSGSTPAPTPIAEPTPATSEKVVPAAPAFAPAPAVESTSKGFFHKTAKPAPAPSQVHAMWKNQIIEPPDSVNQGKPLPGLAGRVYFFGPDLGHPMPASGQLAVDLYELRPDGKAQHLESWKLPHDVLARVGARDTLGWGYTLFLPWATYRPDVQRVRLQVSFVPDGGAAPIFSPPSNVVLQREGVTGGERVVPIDAARK